MQLITYLMFDGHCQEALEFYAKCLGGKIDGIMKYGDSPMADQTPDGLRDKVMHARLTAKDSVLMASDAPPGHFQKPQGFSVSVGIKDLKEAEQVYKELSQGGQVQMEFQKTFWSAGFGMFTDRFGIPWMVNCEQAA